LAVNLGGDLVGIFADLDEVCEGGAAAVNWEFRGKKKPPN